MGGIDELLEMFGYTGYRIQRAKWRNYVRCDCCGTLATKGFRVILLCGSSYEYYCACSREHAEKLVGWLLGSRLAARLSDDPLSVQVVAINRLVQILRKWYSRVKAYEFGVYALPEDGKPEVSIKVFYPHFIKVRISFIEVSHREFLTSLLDEIGLHFMGTNVELEFDLWYTPWYEKIEASKMIRELYCKYYTKYGFRPAEDVVCGSV